MNIFISNLADTMSELHLRELFCTYGTVSAVQVIMSYETGRSEKFAFVEMLHAAEAENAIQQLNGLNFMPGSERGARQNERIKRYWYINKKER